MDFRLLGELMQRRGCIVTDNVRTALQSSAGSTDMPMTQSSFASYMGVPACRKSSFDI